jgi:hypothetical protein
VDKLCVAKIDGPVKCSWAWKGECLNPKHHCPGKILQATVKEIQNDH